MNMSWDKVLLLTLLTGVSACSSMTPVEKVASLDNMEGKYSKPEAVKEFGEPESTCIDHTWTESCKWEIPVNEGRSPASVKNTKTLRLWFDKKGVLVKKNFY